MSISTHYIPRRDSLTGCWGFTTPLGKADGFFSEGEARRAAGSTEAADRVQALDAAQRGPMAKLLRGHFFPEEVVR